MLTIPLSKLVRLCGGTTALLALGSGATLAGDHHGYTYTAKIHQQGALVVAPTTLSYAYAYPYAYAVAPAPTYLTYSLAMPTTSLVTLVPYSVPVAPTYGLAPLSNPAGSNTAAPLLRSALGSSPMLSSGQSSADYLTEYNAFLQQEFAKNPATIYQGAGVRPHPSDLAAFQANHSSLVAVIGADRLASIGRFLLTKRSDPNFRSNAARLFEPLLGGYLPQYASAIDRFLEDLRQGPTSFADDRVPPAPLSPSRNPIEDERPPVPSPTIPPPVSPPSAGLTKDRQTGHFVSTDADGIRTEFDSSMKLLSVTRPDGTVLRFDAAGSPSRTD